MRIDQLENRYFVHELNDVEQGNEPIRSAATIERLRKLLLKDVAAFGTKESPANMSALTTNKLKDQTKVLKATPKSMTKRHLYVLKNQYANMLKKGMIRETSNPFYGSKIFLLDKPNGDGRIITDMSPLNKLTQDTSLQMSNLEEHVSCPKKARVFCSVDILSGYDYLEKADNSKNIS